MHPAHPTAHQQDIHCFEKVFQRIPWLHFCVASDVIYIHIRIAVFIAAASRGPATLKTAHRVAWGSPAIQEKNQPVFISPHKRARNPERNPPEEHAESNSPGADTDSGEFLDCGFYCRA